MALRRTLLRPRRILRWSEDAYWAFRDYWNSLKVPADRRRPPCPLIGVEPLERRELPAGAISIDEYSVGGTEDDTVFTFTARITGGSGGESVQWYTAEVAGSDLTVARMGQDFLYGAGTITFDTGNSTKTFSVTIVEDTHVEATEYFSVWLHNATGGATIVDDSSGGAITDDDAINGVFAVTDPLAGPGADLNGKLVDMQLGAVRPTCGFG